MRRGGGLQRVQAAVEARQVVVVLELRAVVSKHANALGKRVVIGRDGTRVPERAQVLAGIEREAGGVAEAAGPPAAVARTLRLRRVLDHRDAAVPSDRQDPVHVCWASVEVHRHDRLRGRRDYRLHGLRGHVVSHGIRLDRHRSRTRLRDSQPGRDERVGRNQHLVPVAHAVAEENESQRIEAAADANGVIGLAEGRELLLEGGYLGPRMN